MVPLSATIVARNEAANIARCLESLRWVDEIVVVDNQSSDATGEVCRAFGCRVLVSEWLGFGRLKQMAIDAARHDWILALDADEVVSDALRERIRAQLASEPPHAGYRIRFQGHYLGRPLRHAGWGHEYHVRLFDRRRGHYRDRRLHESWQVDGPKGELEEPILHYAYPTIAAHLEKIDRYGRLGAQQLFDEGRRASLVGAAARGAHRFLKMYLAQGGFRDGREGFVLAAISAYGVFHKYLRLWELNRWKRSS
jgi:glycosyltransferase involved in cell wall biosynthesis